MEKAASLSSPVSLLTGSMLFFPFTGLLLWYFIDLLLLCAIPKNFFSFRFSGYVYAFAHIPL